MEIINAIKDTPAPVLMIVAGLFFLTLGFVNKIGGIIEVSSEQRKWTIPIGLFVLIIGLIINSFPSPSPPPSKNYNNSYQANQHKFYHHEDIGKMEQNAANKYCQERFDAFKAEDNLKGDFDPNQVNHVWAHLENHDCIANTNTP